MVALARCGGSDGPAVGVFEGGNVANYDVGTIMRFDAGPFFVVRDDQGLYAMSAVCTHQACTVGENLICPCHASTYDINGAVTGGPADDDLQHYRLEVDANDDITVDTGAPVDASTRVAV